MKFQLLLLLLVLFNFGLSDIVQSFERANCLSAVNKLRTSVAQAKQISNMNMLMYDTELETSSNELISKENCNSDELKTKDFESIRDSKYSATVTNFLSIPGKTKLACIRKVCTRPDQEFILVTDFGLSEPLKNGVPGSACSAGRLTDPLGLCYIPIDLSATDKPLSRPTTTDKDSATSSEIIISLITVFLGVFL